MFYVTNERFEVAVAGIDISQGSGPVTEVLCLMNMVTEDELKNDEDFDGQLIHSYYTYPKMNFVFVSNISAKIFFTGSPYYSYVIEYHNEQSPAVCVPPPPLLLA